MSDDKLWVFARDSRSNGTQYPRMALVPEGMFDPAQRMLQRDRGVIVEIERDELGDLDKLPQPVPERDQRRATVPVVAVQIAGERVTAAKRELAAATREFESLNRGGPIDEPQRGAATDIDIPAHNPLLEDAPSPLDGDPTDAASAPARLEPGAQAAATAPYEGSGGVATQEDTETAPAGELPPYLE